MHWLAALLGASAVACGAFGAHALRGRLEENLFGAWETAVQYHLLHAVAVLALAVTMPRGPWLAAAAWTFAAGVLLFSGSLYALALGGPRWLGPVTPLGGVALIAGWLLVGMAAGTGQWPNRP